MHLIEKYYGIWLFGTVLLIVIGRRLCKMNHSNKQGLLEVLRKVVSGCGSLSLRFPWIKIQCFIFEPLTLGMVLVLLGCTMRACLKMELFLINSICGLYNLNKCLSKLKDVSVYRSPHVSSSKIWVCHEKCCKTQIFSFWGEKPGFSPLRDINVGTVAFPLAGW